MLFALSAMRASPKRIQLRSDRTESEFAICLSDAPGAVLASTSPRASYINVVEETEYIDGQKYEWDFMLERWIESVRSGWCQQQPLPPPVPPEPAFTKQARALIEAVAAASERKKSRGKKGAGRRKKGAEPALKCHYCGLWFESEARRADHEREWHPSKTGASASAGAGMPGRRGGHSL